MEFCVVLHNYDTRVDTVYRLKDVQIVAIDIDTQKIDFLFIKIRGNEIIDVISRDE